MSNERYFKDNKHRAFLYVICRSNLSYCQICNRKFKKHDWVMAFNPSVTVCLSHFNQNKNCEQCNNRYKCITSSDSANKTVCIENHKFTY